MTVLVLAGSIATYIGSRGALASRKDKACTVTKDTTTASPTYPVKFEGEEKTIHVLYENLLFVNKQTMEI